MTSLMSNEKISLTNELNRMKEDINHELEMEKRKHNEDVKQANLRSERQKQEIHKVSLFSIISSIFLGETAQFFVNC